MTLIPPKYTGIAIVLSGLTVFFIALWMIGKVYSDQCTSKHADKAVKCGACPSESKLPAFVRRAVGKVRGIRKLIFKR